MNVLLVAKTLVQLVLFCVFIKYFGLQSWARYQAQTIVSSTSSKRMDFMRAPAITLCPEDPTKAHVDIFEDECSNTEDLTIAECIEKNVISLNEMVVFESEGERGLEVPTAAEDWEFSYTNDPCYTFTSPRHIGTDNKLHSIRLGLSVAFSYKMFLHDPGFFVFSLNPGVKVNELSLEAGRRHLRKIVVVEHQDLSTDSQHCNPGSSYGFTSCVRCNIKCVFFSKLDLTG